MLKRIKEQLEFATKIEGEEYRWKGLRNEDIDWLIEQSEKVEENEVFMKELVSKLDYTLNLVIKRHNEYVSLQEENKKLKETIKEYIGTFEDNTSLRKENENLKEDNEFLKTILRVVRNLSITEVNAGYEIRHYLENHIIGLEKLLK
jgi:hypothetical protein